MKNVIIGMSVLAPTLFLSSCYVTSTSNTYYVGYRPTYVGYGWGGVRYYNDTGWGGYRRTAWYGNNGGVWGPRYVGNAYFRRW